MQKAKKIVYIRARQYRSTSSLYVPNVICFVYVYQANMKLVTNLLKRHVLIKTCFNKDSILLKVFYFIKNYKFLITLVPESKLYLKAM